MSIDESCLFCRIVQGSIPADVVFRDDEIVAFKDINPQAPLHLLLVPREHTASVSEATAEHAALLGRLALAAAKLVEERGLKDSGYRLVLNTGRNAGQTVFHIHLHLLAGRPLAWPPG